jgi:hypothetical protein
MRTASILLIAAVVSASAGHAQAADLQAQYEAVPIIEVPLPPTSDYTVDLNWKLYGIREWAFNDGINENRTIICFGPLGSCRVPCTAIQGVIGGCIFLAVLIILPVVFAVRWKKKRAAR